MDQTRKPEGGFDILITKSHETGDIVRCIVSRTNMNVIRIKITTDDIRQSAPKVKILIACWKNDLLHCNQ